MSAVLQRIEETREALVGALAERNWQAIGELDLACRSCMEDVLSEAEVDEAALRATIWKSCWGSTGNCLRWQQGSARR